MTSIELIQALENGFVLKNQWRDPDQKYMPPHECLRYIRLRKYEIDGESRRGIIRSGWGSRLGETTDWLENLLEKPEEWSIIKEGEY